MRICGRICRLILYLVPLMLALSPVMVLAQEEKIDLTLRLMPGYYNKEVIPGEEHILYLEVRNTGDKPITNIRFSSDGPEDWVVRFRPASISSLGASSSQTIDVSVTPASNAEKGEYQISLIADADETRKVITSFLRVETVNSVWLWIGIAVAALVIAGFVVVYRRFGRQ